MATLIGMDGAARYRGVQYKTRAYLTNGRNALRVYDGTTWYRAGIEQYLFVPTVASNGAGNLTGRYRYMVQPVNTLHTTPLGRPIAGLPSFMSAELNLNAQQAQLTGIPSSHPNSQVNFWNIYRNKGGSFNPAAPIEGQDFYYVGQVAVGTTSFNDNVADNQLALNDNLRYNQMIPQGLKNTIVFGDRVFSFGYDPLTNGNVTKTTINISSGTAANNVLDITCGSAHGLSVGQYVLINTGKSEWDGPRQVTAVVSTTEFKCVSWNDNQTFTTASVSSGTIEFMRFSQAVPDGVAGLWINLPDGNDYRVWYRNSAFQCVLDRPYSGATLSNGAFTIYHKEWEVMVHEFEDPEAAGPIAYAYRWTREVPGLQPARAGIVWSGRLLIFTPYDIYAIDGKDPDISNITITPEPIYKGLGCVGMDAVDYVEQEVYFMSNRGPAVMIAGGPPQLIGQTLLTDWLDTLNSADRQVCTVGCEGRYVYFDFPAATGDTENSLCWRYDRYFQEWHKERYKHTAFYFRSDAGDGKLQLYYAQGASIFQPNSGTFDETTQVYSGTATAGSTLSLTDSGANFPTANGGLVEAYVHLFDATGTYQASRRIVSNGATSVTWSASGAGGGTVSTPAAGWTYKIGNIWWYWYTRKWQNPPTSKRDLTAYVLFDNYVDANATTIPTCGVTEYRNGKIGKLQIANLNEAQKTFDVNARNNDFQLKVESQDGAVIRAISDDAAVKATEQGAGSR